MLLAVRVRSSACTSCKSSKHQQHQQHTSPAVLILLPTWPQPPTSENTGPVPWDPGQPTSVWGCGRGRRRKVGVFDTAVAVTGSLGSRPARHSNPTFASILCNCGLTALCVCNRRRRRPASQTQTWTCRLYICTPSDNARRCERRWALKSDNAQCRRSEADGMPSDQICSGLRRRAQASQSLEKALTC